MAQERPVESSSLPSDHATTGRAAAEERSEISLVIDDQDRYSRLRLISWWRQDRLRSARVLVVGAGRWATR